jgi:hypothetical protein
MFFIFSAPLFEGKAVRSSGTDGGDLISFNAEDKLFVYGIHLSNAVYLVDGLVFVSYFILFYCSTNHRQMTSAANSINPLSTRLRMMNLY